MVKQIDFENIDDRLKNNSNIIYGAGKHGMQLYDALAENGITVEAFYDDDCARWGEIISDNGKKIISRTEFENLSKQCNIIISSMYLTKIYKKTEDVGFENIYACSELILQDDVKILGLDQIKENIKKYSARLDKLIERFDDVPSKTYFEIIKESIYKGKSARIFDICSDERQYFLKEIIPLLHNVVVVDVGAYTGDTIEEMMELGIQFKKVYAFEADRVNYERLNGRCKDEFTDVVAENCAVWDSNTRLKVTGSNFCASVDESADNATVSTVVLDEYFKGIPVDFIKMDIEGAEMKALYGGGVHHKA